MRYIIVILLLLGLPKVGWKGEDKIALSAREVDALVDSMGRDYYGAKFAFYPAYATSKGVRAYDGDLSTFSGQRVGGFVRRITRLQRVLGGFHEDSLSMDSWIDLNALSSDMATQLLVLEELELWRRSPMLYSDACISGVYYLLIRPGEADINLSLASRLEAIPEVVAHARTNLTDPIRLHCEVASRGIRDFLPFLEGLKQNGASDRLDLDDALFEHAHQALLGFAAYLDSLAVTADTDFSLGREAFVRLLEVRHMIHESPEDLVAYAERVLAQARAQKEESTPMRPDLYFRNIPDTGPLTRDDVKNHIHAEVESALVFVLRKDLLTLPEDARIEIVETPPFMRSLVPGYAYEPPGPFDPVQVGLFYVPLPGEMDLETEEYYKARISRRGFAGAVVHETFPGHHVQMVAANGNASFIRKLQDDIFAIEGWALYCEELMAREGYYGEEGMTRALDGIIYRAARVIVDVRLQLGDFSLDEAVDFMVNQTGASRGFVEKEVRRYAVEPAQAMSYLIGKRAVVSMRGEFSRIMGESFTLREFHDCVLSCGSLPLYLLGTCVKSRAMERL